MSLYDFKSERKKCSVIGCTNHTKEGTFVGNLCMPCYEFLINGEGIYSQAYRNNQLKDDLEILVKEYGIELVEITLKTMTVPRTRVELTHKYEGDIL